MIQSIDQLAKYDSKYWALSEDQNDYNINEVRFHTGCVHMTNDVQITLNYKRICVAVTVIL